MRKFKKKDITTPLLLAVFFLGIALMWLLVSFMLK